MKHLKRYDEGFLDIFKKDSSDDKITLDMIHRLEKVKDSNPYEIHDIMKEDMGLPTWMSKASDTAERGSKSEYYSVIYVVRFDDVDILICNDRHNLVYNNTGLPAGEKKCVNQWKLFIGNNTGLCERIRSKESYRIKLFHLIDKIYKEDIERKRIDRIQTEINPAADLLEEGFLDMFKKDTDEDKVVLEFIKRLEKVKDINPYEIQKRETSNNAGSYTGYKVMFDDTPIFIKRIKYKQRHEMNDYNLIKYKLEISLVGDWEEVSCKDRYYEKIFELVDKIYKSDEHKKKMDKITTEINPAADLLEKSIYEREVIFTNKRNPRLVITIKKNPDGRITEIENETGLRFPFSVGQILNRTAEVWACNNNFLMDGKDTCPDKKIFGVKTKDVPQGHEWRHIFPHKF